LTTPNGETSEVKIGYSPLATVLHSSDQSTTSTNGDIHHDTLETIVKPDGNKSYLSKSTLQSSHGTTKSYTSTETKGSHTSSKLVDAHLIGGLTDVTSSKTTTTPSGKTSHQTY
jgi:hypothetical protein